MEPIFMRVSMLSFFDREFDRTGKIQKLWEPRINASQFNATTHAKYLYIKVGAKYQKESWVEPISSLNLSLKAFNQTAATVLLFVVQFSSPTRDASKVSRVLPVAPLPWVCYTTSLLSGTIVCPLCFASTILELLCVDLCSLA
ncbi:unnamed protein product [Prorocentrum cordatum]|uniref:Uncharacterized protein n=1 Tax=Prorocentrum cordatum TaxID=2364126 RepID=A0ABN9WU13_9DINO|nr:unnamed protein product [Polarella glacialis]